ncbi:MAG: amidohydrolase family protein [Solirubrobacteraceae bacterium]
MRLIALEEAFWLDDLQTSGSFVGSGTPFRKDLLAGLGEKLSDFTKLRLPEMDRAGVDVQVLSLTSPGVQMQPDTATAVADARKANHFLAEVVADHPDRFAGLAAVALQDPDEAAAELRRAIGLGLRGVLVNDHTLGRYLDEPEYAGFWETLEELDAPLYIHPSASPPGLSVVEGHPELIGPTFSWAVMTGGHAMRLIYAGVFDRYPTAKIILGHMGEFLPFQLSRLDIRHKDLDLPHPIERLPSEYFGRNILATTTGVLSHSTLIALIQAIGIDAVMFSVDYPYESSENAAEFMRSAPLAPADKAKVAHLNAERILKLPTSD